MLLKQDFWDGGRELPGNDRFNGSQANMQEGRRAGRRSDLEHLVAPERRQLPLSAGVASGPAMETDA